MRTIIITESVADEIRKEYEMSEHRFISNVKHFLANLLQDPVNAKPSDVLLHNGYDRTRLLKELSENGVVERQERVSDKDKDGNWKTASMLVTYKVKRKGLDTALIRIYSEGLGENETGSRIDEEGGGATACDGGMAFSGPVFPMITRNGSFIGRKKRKKKRSRK